MPRSGCEENGMGKDKTAHMGLRIRAGQRPQNNVRRSQPGKILQEGERADKDCLQRSGRIRAGKEL